MFIDTHVHLDAAEFDLDRDAVVARAAAAGVRRLVIPAVEAANFSVVRQLARAIPGSAYALGIHPLYVDRADEADVALLRQQLADSDACAVGEIGLDGFVQPQNVARQELFFVEQLKVAKELDLPVVLHVRRAQDRVLKYLRRYKLKGGIAHAFNGSRQQAEAFIGLGFKLGFGGAMTYSGSLRIRELAATLPLESIVLESDAPDIPPAWRPGARNEPENVARFASILGELRGLGEDGVAAIARATSHNAVQALRL